MATEIKKCTCTGTPACEFQDNRYGNQMRVCNNDSKNKNTTCTVCGKVHKLDSGK